MRLSELVRMQPDALWDVEDVVSEALRVGQVVARCFIGCRGCSLRGSKNLPGCSQMLYRM
jgi:hypothetical protein